VEIADEDSSPDIADRAMPTPIFLWALTTAFTSASQVCADFDSFLHYALSDAISWDLECY
jgi:hypothetical protein